MSGWFAARFSSASTIRALQAENAELRRQYGERVALERRNLRDLEDRYNTLKAQYDDLALRYDALQARFRSERRQAKEVA